MHLTLVATAAAVVHLLFVATVAAVAPVRAAQRRSVGLENWWSSTVATAATIVTWNQ